MLLKHRRKNRKGFTLIELIVVVAVLAILAAVAIPSFIGMTDKAKAGVDIANASAVAGVVNAYNAMQTNSASWFTTTNPTWAQLEAVGGLEPMLPVISGGTGANLAAWQDKAASLVIVDAATGVATVDTSGLQ